MIVSSPVSRGILTLIIIIGFSLNSVVQIPNAFHGFNAIDGVSYGNLLDDEPTARQQVV
jgi:hypothetical protein